MEFTQKEQDEFTKNLISGVESGFCKIDTLETKKSKSEPQNKIAYDSRGVPNWMAKPFLKYDSLKYWVLLVLFIVLFALGVAIDANDAIQVGIKLIFCAYMLIGVAYSLCLLLFGEDSLNYSKPEISLNTAKDKANSMMTKNYHVGQNEMVLKYKTLYNKMILLILAGQGDIVLTAIKNDDKGLLISNLYRKMVLLDPKNPKTKLLGLLRDTHLAQLNQNFDEKINPILDNETNKVIAKGDALSLNLLPASYKKRLASKYADEFLNGSED